jgi:2,4-dienoyl-CoA reductase-like NADH-dependent reductase (Old Yellow Enzyme family)
MPGTLTQPLLEPYRLGDLELGNRIVMAPLTRTRAANFGHIQLKGAIDIRKIRRCRRRLNETALIELFVNSGRGQAQPRAAGCLATWSSFMSPLITNR